jgi:DNA-binding NarL/FixJ family response regulator
MIRVLLADDQGLIRAGFRMLLDAEADIEIVAEASDGQQAVEQAMAVKPDVVLMDIRMPRLDGVEATRAIVAEPALSDVRVVILTTYETDDYVFEALRAGASGFLLKDTDPPDLIRAIHVAAAGEALLTPSVTRRLIANYASRPRSARTAPRELDELTDREREVLSLVAQGLSNDEIAEELVISPLTAKTHVSRTMLKLSARDRAQLVVIAYQSGLVTPDAR